MYRDYFNENYKYLVENRRDCDVIKYLAKNINDIFKKQFICYTLDVIVKYNTEDDYFEFEIMPFSISIFVYGNNKFDIIYTNNKRMNVVFKNLMIADIIKLFRETDLRIELNPIYRNNLNIIELTLNTKNKEGINYINNNLRVITNAKRVHIELENNNPIIVISDLVCNFKIYIDNNKIYTTEEGIYFEYITDRIRQYLMHYDITTDNLSEVKPKKSESVDKPKEINNDDKTIFDKNFEFIKNLNSFDGYTSELITAFLRGYLVLDKKYVITVSRLYDDPDDMMFIISLVYNFFEYNLERKVMLDVYIMNNKDILVDKEGCENIKYTEEHAKMIKDIFNTVDIESAVKDIENTINKYRQV